MELNCIYSRASEFRVIQETLADLESINAGRYDVWLPDGISSQSSPTDIRGAVEHELDPGAVATARAGLRNFFDRTAIDIESFAERYATTPPTVLSVTLTRYGVGGYYELPNRIVINLRSTWDTLESVFVHELVHLLIEESVVQTLKLDDAAKEGLVDYLFLHDPILRALIPSYRPQTQVTPPSPELIQHIHNL